MNAQSTTAKTTFSHVPADSVANQEAVVTTNFEQQKKDFREKGYAVFKNVVSRDRLTTLHKTLSAEFDRAKQEGRLLQGGGTISGHLNCSPGVAAEFAYQELEKAGIIAFVREMFPKATGMPNVGCNFNLPHSVAQHFHADRNFMDNFVITNVAVVDTVIANGAMEIAPATHQKFYKFWRFAVERPHRDSLRLEMQQGDVVVRDSNVWHRGMPNHTAAPRPMLAFTWEDGGSKHADPFRVDEGKVVFRQNWFRPSPLGRLRERVFVSAPVSYSAYRFVTSLFDGTKGYDHQ